MEIVGQRKFGPLLDENKSKALTTSEPSDYQFTAAGPCLVHLWYTNIHSSTLSGCSVKINGGDAVVIQITTKATSKILDGVFLDKGDTLRMWGNTLLIAHGYIEKFE